MCGIVAIVGGDPDRTTERMIARLAHRGPDARAVWRDGGVSLGHARLSIIDLSEAANQPMVTDRYALVFNGEIYNYLELRRELAGYPFRTQGDSEVILAAWERWGEAALDRLVGMFAILLWDRTQQRLIAARDRFGVKPLYHARLPDGRLAFASEIKALHAAGVEMAPDDAAWASYLAHGASDGAERTFWRGVHALPASTIMNGTPRCWYDFAAATRETDLRDETIVREEYAARLRESVALRFRSDVPVGINLSGGVDSSLLLALVDQIQGAANTVEVYTFETGDERYDETPWVTAMLARTHHPLQAIRMTADEVPALAARMTEAQDEPFGGLPTLAYGKLFAAARARGTYVLLDGQGMDEQWAGYDYYRASGPASVVQGTRDPATRPECLAPAFAALASPVAAGAPFGDRLRDLQYRDTFATKLPRALRYNDRASMAASTELREPFLDHRMFELAFRQPADRKLGIDTGKRMLRDITAALVPADVGFAPKRPLQTPQREWLRGPLRDWADAMIERALERPWFERDRVRTVWREFLDGRGDNSFWVWQWISVGLHSRSSA